MSSSSVKSKSIVPICKDYLPTYVVVYGESLVNLYVNALSQNSNHYHRMIIQIIHYLWTTLFYFCPSKDGIIKCIVSILTTPFTKENQWIAENAVIKLPTILRLNDWQSRNDTSECKELLFSKPLIGIYPCTLYYALTLDYIFILAHYYIDTNFMLTLGAALEMDFQISYLAVVVLQSCESIKALFEINPMASPLREAEIHLIVQNAIDEWLLVMDNNGIEFDDDGLTMEYKSLTVMIKLGVEIISLIPKEDKQRQSSLIRYGIISTLNHLTQQMLDLYVWEWVSKIILNISNTQIVGLHNDDDVIHDIDLVMRIDEVGHMVNAELLRFDDLIRLSHQSWEFAFVLKEEEQEQDVANHILENALQCFANILSIHARPIMNHLPSQVFKQMIQILTLTENITIRETILIILDAVMQNNVNNINTLVNQCDLLDALQKIINTSCDNYVVFTILSRLLDSCHASKIFDDYPLIMTITIKNAFPAPYLQSINCLNSLLQNNNNSLFIKTNYLESMCIFLKRLDMDDCLEGLAPYHALFHNTLNALNNMDWTKAKILLQDVIKTLKKYDLKMS